MVNLNLLPQIEKENYKIEITRRFAVFFSIGVFIIFIILISLLIVEYLFIFLQAGPLNQLLSAEQNTNKAGKMEELERKIKDANKEIAAISSARNQIAPILPIIEQISKATSSKESYIKTLLIDRANNNIIISGYSKTRDDVVRIQDNLKKEASFENINAPYANFLKQKDINFTFDFKITPALNSR